MGRAASPVESPHTPPTPEVHWSRTSSPFPVSVDLQICRLAKRRPQHNNARNVAEAQEEYEHKGVGHGKVCDTEYSKKQFTISLRLFKYAALKQAVIHNQAALFLP